MLTVGSTLLAVAICVVLPRIERQYSLTSSTQYAIDVCAASAELAAALDSWIVVGTPGLTMNAPVGPLGPTTGWWWRPSSAPMLIVTGAAMSIVNWPLAFVVITPTPGTLTCTPSSAVLISADHASGCVRVHAISVTVVGIGGAAGGANGGVACAAPVQPGMPHSCLSLR
jgi:hypothetical protein